MDRVQARRGGPLLAFVLAWAGCAAHGAGVTQPPAAEGTPLEVVRSFYGSLHAGDGAGAARLLATADGARITASFVTMARAYRQLEDAIRDRFGDDAAHLVGYHDRVEAEEAALRAAREAVSGAEAAVTSGDRTLASLRLAEGKWRIVVDDDLESPGGTAALASEAEAARAAAERVTPAIRGGLFDSAADAVEAFRNELAVATQRLEPELPRRPDQTKSETGI